MEQRTFNIKHADPKEVEQAIRTLYGGRAGGKRRGKGAAADLDNIRTATTSGGIIVSAAKEKMPQIADLVETMDSPEIMDAIVTERFEVDR